MPAEDVFICEYVRTPDRPLRRRACEGAHRRSRRRCRSAHCSARIPSVDWRPSTTSSTAAPTRPARTTATSRAWRALLAGLPERTSRRHHQPPVRLRPRCGRRRGARDQGRRDRADDRRRRRVMTRAPFVMGKAEAAFQRTTRDLRHHHRLALRQPADEGAVRRRFDAGDRRERRAGLPGHARGAGRLRAAQPEARRRGAGRRHFSRARSCRSRSPDRKGDRCASTRTSIRAPTRRSRRSPSSKPIVRAGGTVTAGNASGVNDGAAALILASAKRGGAARPDAARARPRPAPRPACRRAIMGIGPVPAIAQARRAARRQGRGFRRDRAQRGLRLAGARRACASSASPEDAEHVNPNGGAIALGHPLGMSGARIAGDRRPRALAPRRQARRSPPCASASGRASRWRSSGSDPALPGRRPAGTQATRSSAAG